MTATATLALNITSFRIVRLPSSCAPKLYRSVGNAEAAGSAVNVSFFFRGRAANGDFLRSAADLLEPRAGKHGALDLPLEMGI